MTRGERLSKALARAHVVAALDVLRHSSAPIGATELADRMGGSRTYGSAMAGHLQAHGLAKVREVDGVAGKHRYLIELTDLGRSLIDALDSAIDVYEGHFTDS